LRAKATTFEAVTEEILAEQPFLSRLALRLSRRRADADDLVQETMLRAYDARDRFQTGTSMRAWLATILRRLFLTSAIKAKRRATQTDTDAGDVIQLSGAIARTTPPPLSYEQSLEHVDDRLKDALERLQATYRVPFVMFALDGFSYAEIAEQLRIPVGTVMSRIHRARQRLKDRLAETEETTAPSPGADALDPVAV
jgi:RNA polymerase sigma-70 factor (ECF subfamily)